MMFTENLQDLIPAEKRLIPADAKEYAFTGRIDFDVQNAPVFVFAGSAVTIRFTGTSAGILIRNRRFYNNMEVGFLLDGAQGKLSFDENDKAIYLPVAENLTDGTHELTVFKRQDATHCFAFFGAVLDADACVLTPPPAAVRRMECYGDSVSAGAVSEAWDCAGAQDPPDTQGVFDNAFYSYAAITARNLGASLHNVAQGGIAVFDHTGYYHAPDCIGMETAYDKLIYFPEGGVFPSGDGVFGMKAWDFARYTPQAVLFAVGQNDPHREGFPDNDIRNSAYRASWKAAYKRILTDLLGKYPRAHFVLLTTVLMHDAQWDAAIEEIRLELDSPRVSHFYFRRNGAATPGHPRITEQYEMAEELTAYLSAMGDALWAD
ncbi:MAG: electron transporter RnfD [Oscillospiraceae bacterium]